MIRFLAAFILLAPLAAHAQKLTILLDWFVNPDHAPLVIAQQKGFFKAEGLDITLIAPSDPNDPPKLVAAGKADIAISYQPQLHLQVAEGLPVRRFGTLIASPLNSLVVLEESNITSIKHLKGKTIGYSVGGVEEALLDALLKPAGLSRRDVKLVNVNFSLSPALLTKKVDAVIGAYRNFELHQLAQAGKKGRAFYIERYGVPMYDELIFVENSKIKNTLAHDKFLKAIANATIWLQAHPADAWQIFKKAYPETDDAVNRAAWKDTVGLFNRAPDVLNIEQYQSFDKFLYSAGLIKNPSQLKNLAR